MTKRIMLGIAVLTVGMAPCFADTDTTCQPLLHVYKERGTLFGNLRGSFDTLGKESFSTVRLPGARECTITNVYFRCSWTYRGLGAGELTKYQQGLFGLLQKCIPPSEQLEEIYHEPIRLEMRVGGPARADQWAFFIHSYTGQTTEILSLELRKRYL